MEAPPPVHRRRYQLPRCQRLRGAASFALIRRLGRRVVSRCFIMNWLETATSAGRPVGELGVVTSRKVGSAVVRNRARRLLREAYRRHQHALRGPVRLVLVARAAIRGASLAEVEREFLAVLRRNALLAASP